MRRYKVHSDKFKALALELLRGTGYPGEGGKHNGLDRTAKHLGISYQTLYNWWQRENGSNKVVDEETREEVREELSELFESEIRGIFQELKIKREDATYKDLGIVLGITTEKLQLITGGATSNNVNQNSGETILRIVEVDAPVQDN